MSDTDGVTERWLEGRLIDVLEREADTIEVRDAWDEIASRLTESASGTAPRLTQVSRRQQRRRTVGVGAICLGVAAALVAAMVIGWRPPSATPRPAAPPNTNASRYDLTIPTLVVYRCNVEVIPANQPKGSVLAITPERMRTDIRDVGIAALNALFDTDPLHPGNASWAEQHIDATSVRVTAGVIRVELDAFTSHVFSPAAAHVMAQAWVRTLQDSLGVSDDVLITLQGRPFLLYGQIDTSQPLSRDPKTPVVRTTGIDSPHDGEVVPSTFILLGSAIASRDRPGRILITEVDSRTVVVDERVSGTTSAPEAVDLTTTLTLEPGRYQAVLTGIDHETRPDTISFTVTR